MTRLDLQLPVLSSHRRGRKLSLDLAASNGTGSSLEHQLKQDVAQPNLRRRAGQLAAGVIFSALASAAGATESGGGRPVAGTAVNPSAGVVPDQPIMMFNLGLQAVDGNIGANKQIPIAGRIAGEAENQYTLQSLSLFKVWDTGPGAWHFASSLTMLFMQSEVTVQAFVPPAPGLDHSAKVAGLYDLAITPIVAGYHFSKDEHLSLSLRVWAPTGRYVSGKLVNLSQNVWTAIPTLSYTRYLPQGWEVSSVATLNFSTRNKASNYQSAPLFTLDVLGSKKLGDGWAMGAIAGWIEQIGKDSGPLADKLNGFRGSELALGPIVTYSSKIGALPLSSSFRWMNTVSQRNRMDRNTFYLSFSVPVPL
ncbi:transporter [Paucibacter sp. TC2R-5]|uniref:SphA family protein n=1 Tax=Paucibacter sp. TC2R-5 TaxID=2893555 RepID=UPI0021E4581B|nr:transporter [Paucibacter sp. TC2R-5]